MDWGKVSLLSFKRRLLMGVTFFGIMGLTRVLTREFQYGALFSWWVNLLRCSRQSNPGGPSGELHKVLIGKAAMFYLTSARPFVIFSISIYIAISVYWMQEHKIYQKRVGDFQVQFACCPNWPRTVGRKWSANRWLTVGSGSINKQ